MRPKLVRRGRNRTYYDLDRPIPGEKTKYERIPGVTTIVRAGLPKEALTNYAGTATAEFAVDNWPELDALPPAERLKRLNAGRYEKRDAAAQRGQEIHGLARALVTGVEVPVPTELFGYVKAAERFMDEFEVIEIAAEMVIFSQEHYYCGTLDLAASVLIPDLPVYDWIPLDDDGRARGLFDYKTSPSGIWGDLAYQLAPYRFADYAILPGSDPDDPEIIEVPRVDFAAGIHLRGDGTYSVVPVDCGDQEFEDFLTIKENASVADRSKFLTLTEIVPPHGPRYQLTKIEDE
jgi:hypothetical protein